MNNIAYGIVAYSFVSRYSCLEFNCVFLKYMIHGYMISNGPSGGQIMLIAKRLKNYTGYVTTKSRDRGVATSPPRSIICNTVQYEYDYQLGNQHERLRYEYSYDCFFVRFRFIQCTSNKKYGTQRYS